MDISRRNFTEEVGLLSHYGPTVYSYTNKIGKSSETDQKGIHHEYGNFLLDTEDIIDSNVLNNTKN